MQCACGRSRQVHHAALVRRAHLLAGVAVVAVQVTVTAAREWGEGWAGSARQLQPCLELLWRAADADDAVPRGGVPWLYLAPVPGAGRGSGGGVGGSAQWRGACELGVPAWRPVAVEACIGSAPHASGVVEVEVATTELRGAGAGSGAAGAAAVSGAAPGAGGGSA